MTPSRPRTETSAPEGGIDARADAFGRMLLVRRVEERLLALFSEGRLAGTTHTAIGQEVCAVGVMAALDPKRDLVFSTHRCHGHYLAWGGPLDGLLAEVMGREGGICRGRGGSQHLCWNGFHSNGIQGGSVPIACGAASALALEGRGGLACVFLGDGTFGEGAVYEALNLASLRTLPVLFVVEDNGIAQTTPKRLALAGGIPERFRAFAIPAVGIRAADPLQVRDAARALAADIRAGLGPRALVLGTCRLGPHSKGDDLRDPEEIARAREDDPLAHLERSLPAEAVRAAEHAAGAAIEAALATAEASPEPAPDTAPPPPGPAVPCAYAVPTLEGRPRTVERLNAALRTAFAQDPRVHLVGEDVLDPYGGAFKVARGLSTAWPERVISTPISEAGLTGLATGMALRGLRPIAEIMFGDFITLALDQLVNHAAKLRWMYADQVRVPLLVRAPMGGGRGYGPTHSQSLERLFLGVPGLRVVAVHGFSDPAATLLTCLSQEDPVLLVENKLQYARPLLEVPEGFDLIPPSHPLGPTRITPRFAAPELTLLTYGGLDHVVAEVLVRLRAEEIAAEALLCEQISPADAFLDALEASVRRTGRLLVAEEGTGPFGFGAEAAAALAERGALPRGGLRRVSALPFPIPAAPSLERLHLPGFDPILAAAASFWLDPRSSPET